MNFSKIPNYFSVATKAILEMVNQVGTPTFDENGIMKKGVIIRHLTLPNHLTETKYVLKWIKENIGDKAFVSVMAQYFPTYKADEFEDINRKLNKKEYTFLLKMVSEFDNGYIQELGSHEEEYVPNFDLRGV